MSSAPELPAKRYEPDRLSRRGAIVFLVVLIAGAVVIHVGVWWLYRDLIAAPRAVDAPRSVVSPEDVAGYRTLPPLNEDGAAAQRTRENEVFEKLGWTIDPQTHRATIPQPVVEAVQRQAQRE
jgi:hypothetical protein